MYFHLELLHNRRFLFIKFLRNRKKCFSFSSLIGNNHDDDDRPREEDFENDMFQATPPPSFDPQQNQDYMDYNNPDRDYYSNDYHDRSLYEGPRAKSLDPEYDDEYTAQISNENNWNRKLWPDFKENVKIF